MSQTYDKKTVLAAADKTVQAVLAERKILLAKWDSKNIAVRFLLGMIGIVRPDYHGISRQKIAERVSFKAAFCIEDATHLTDDEIDAIKHWWLVEETPKACWHE
jgi:AMMECR1 domain-containing protein